MAKVTVHSAGVADEDVPAVKSSNPQTGPALPPGTVEVVSSDGKVIRMRRKIGVLQHMDLMAALGAEHSENALLVNYALIAGSVVSIDGDLIPAPESYRQIRSVIARLSDDGCEAVASEMALWAKERAEHKADPKK